MNIDLSVKGLENGFRLLVPVALLGLLFLLNVTALPLPIVGPVKPALILMAVYYWSIYRPTLMPPFLCFLIGLTLDIVSYLPLGVNAIVFTLVQLIVRDQRKFLMGQAYITIWAVFAFVAFGATMVQWLLYGWVNGHLAPAIPVLISVAATILLFPVITLFLILTHRILPEPSKKAY